MSFRSRMFLHFAWLMALMVVLSIVVVDNRVNHFAITRERGDLVHSPDRFATFQRAKMEVLIAQAVNISADPALRGTLTTGDRATVAQAADRIHALYNTDLFWVLDREGTVLHRVESPQQFGDSLARRPVVSDALGGYDSGDLWKRSGRLLQVAAVPIVAGRSQLGVLLVGEDFSGWISREFAQLTGSEIVFVTRDSCLATSDTLVDPFSLKRALDNLQQRGDLRPDVLPSVPWRGRGPGNNPPEAPFVQFETRNNRQAGAVFALKDASHTTLAYGLVFRSLAPVSQMLSRMRSSMILVGFGTVLLALLASYTLARGLTGPISQLVAAARRLGKGDLETSVELERNDEIGTLAHALDEMRLSLSKARQELIQTERLSTIGRMASTITHDFRQPISAIYGYMQLLSMQQPSAEQRETYSRQVTRQIERMQGMIDELLDFARGEYRLELAELDLRSFVEEIAANFSSESKTLSITIGTEVTGQPTVVLDRNRIERGIENIIRNAIQAIGRGGKVILSAQELGEEVELVIADDGPGIPESIREELFDAFVTHGKSQGTGLGLAVAKSVIEEHGGRIDVDSEEGEGTRFVIHLPRRPKREGYMA